MRKLAKRGKVLRRREEPRKLVRRDDAPRKLVRREPRKLERRNVATLDPKVFSAVPVRVSDIRLAIEQALEPLLTKHGMLVGVALHQYGPKYASVNVFLAKEEDQHLRPKRHI